MMKERQDTKAEELLVAEYINRLQYETGTDKGHL